MSGEIGVSIGQFSSAGRKERNDDSYGVAVPAQPLLATKGVAMAIADGMSSSEAAKTASETCVRGFLEDYFGTHESWAVKTSAGRVLTGLNRWLYSQSQRQFDSESALVTTFSGLILKAGTGYTTLEIKVNYVRAMTDKTGPVKACLLYTSDAADE